MLNRPDSTPRPLRARHAPYGSREPSPNGVRRGTFPVLGAVAVLLGAGIGALALAPADTVELLAVSRPLRAGAVVRLDDLVVVEVPASAGLSGVPNGAADSVVGGVLPIDAPAGALLHGQWFDASSDSVEVVGVRLGAGAYPELALAAGDRVSAHLVPDRGQPGVGSTVVARVAAVSTLDRPDELLVAIEVSPSDAPAVVAAAARGGVRLGLSRSTNPLDGSVGSPQQPSAGGHAESTGVDR